MTTETDLSKRSLMNTDIPTSENFYTHRLPFQHGVMQTPTMLSHDGAVDVKRRYAPDDTPGLQNVLALGRLPNGFGDYSNGLIMIYTTTELGGETLGPKSQFYNGDGIPPGPSTYHDLGWTAFPGNINGVAVPDGCWTLPRVYVRAAVHKATPLVDYATGWSVVPNFRYRMILNPSNPNYGLSVFERMLYNNLNLHPGVGLGSGGFNAGVDNYVEWMPQASISTQTIGSEVYVYLSTGFPDYNKFNTDTGGPYNVDNFPVFIWEDYPQNSSNDMRGSYVIRIKSDLSVTNGYVPFTGISSIFSDNQKNANIWMITTPVNGAFYQFNFKFSEITNINSNTMQIANYTSFTTGHEPDPDYHFEVEGSGPFFGKSGLVPMSPYQYKLYAEAVNGNFTDYGFPVPPGASGAIQHGKYGAGIGCLVHPWSAGDYGPPEVWTFELANVAKDTFTIWRHKWDAGHWISYPKATIYNGAIPVSTQKAHGAVQDSGGFKDVLFAVPVTGTYHDDSTYMAGKSSHPKYNPKGYGFTVDPYKDPANIVGKIGPIPAQREYETLLDIVAVDTTNVTFRVVRDAFHRGVLHLIAMDLWASGGSYNPFTDTGYSPVHSLVLSNAVWYARSVDDGATWSIPVKTHQLTGPRDETFKSYRTKGFVANGAQTTQQNSSNERDKPVSMAQNCMIMTYDNIPLVGCVDYWNYYDASNNRVPFFKPGTEHAGAHLSLYAFTENIGLSGANSTRSDIVFKKPTAI